MSDDPLSPLLKKQGVFVITSKTFLYCSFYRRKILRFRNELKAIHKPKTNHALHTWIKKIQWQTWLKLLIHGCGFSIFKIYPRKLSFSFIINGRYLVRNTCFLFHSWVPNSQNPVLYIVWKPFKRVLKFYLLQYAL